jgi:hypothetical protein
VSDQEWRGLYWATGSWALPWDADCVLAPRRWVAESPLYQAVAHEFGADRIAELHARRAEFASAPTLEKCVAEAVYEQRRRELVPRAPGRLDCLFAAEDAIAAIDFLAAYGAPLQFDASGMSESGAMPVSTADGVWVALDMQLFQIPELADRTDENERALSALLEEASRYWSGGSSPIPFVEVLCEKLWRWTAFIDDQGAPDQFAVWIRRRQRKSPS